MSKRVSLIFIVESLGRYFTNRLEKTGRFGRFLWRTLLALFTPPFKFRRVLKRIDFIGTRSLWLIGLISAFTGAVMSLQIYYVLVQFGAQSRVGTAVALSLIRELGPVVCAIMVAGRAGSSLASELGIMQISEQFDALKIMGLDPFRYFMAPILVASVVSVFLLTAVFNVVGILGGYAVAGFLLDVSWGAYFGGITDFVVMHDINSGVVKSLVFGLIVAWVSTYKGYHTGHGAEGVSEASTEAVVLSSVLILASDYIMTSIMF
jgi:phospholipid/cholesterol/gamma-HCH transport system permease protein